MIGTLSVESTADFQIFTLNFFFFYLQNLLSELTIAKESFSLLDTPIYCFGHHGQLATTLWTGTSSISLGIVQPTLLNCLVSVFCLFIILYLSLITSDKANYGPTQCCQCGSAFYPTLLFFLTTKATQLKRRVVNY